MIIYMSKIHQDPESSFIDIMILLFLFYLFFGVIILFQSVSKKKTRPFFSQVMVMIMGCTFGLAGPSLFHTLQARFNMMYIWWFPRMGVPPNGWFIMENPSNMDHLAVYPYFKKLPYTYIYIYIYVYIMYILG